MDLSVVIAASDSRDSIADCLTRLELSCQSLDAEFIVIVTDDETARLASGRNDRTRIVRLPPRTLTPLLWAEGYRQSTGRVVAFTTGHCLADPRWASALLSTLDTGAAGAGGPLVIAAGARVLDWAIYFLRYSAFMPGTIGRGRIDGEIAGDNAAYRRSTLQPHEATFENGFWELDVHRRIRAQGGWLAAAPDAVMGFGRAFRAGAILRQRFEHGTRFGAERVAGGSHGVARIIASAPLVPVVLWLRAFRRVLRSSGATGRFLLATPWFLVLAGAWALGEARGALRPGRSA